MRHDDDANGICRRGRRPGVGSAIIGLGLLALGVILTIDNLGLADASALLPFWPVLLLLRGLSHLVRPAGERRVTAGLVWLFVGAVLLLDNLGMIDFDLWDLWPIILVIIGASLLLRGFRRREPIGAEDASTIDATAILGGGALIPVSRSGYSLLRELL